MDQEILSQAKDQTSLSRFKEDIVNALYQIEDKMSNKTNSLESRITSSISVFESRINNLDRNITEVITKQKEINKQTELLTDSLPKQTKHEESILSHEIRLNSLQKDITTACYKYDKIFLDNLILPGQIGDYCKYKNLRECLDYILTQISLANNFKDKILCEGKQFRERSDQSIKGCLAELEMVNKTCLNYTKNQLEFYQKDSNDKIEECVKMIKQIKLGDKGDELVSIKDKVEEMKEDVRRLIGVKEEIEEIKERALKEVSDNNSLMNDYAQLKNEFTKLNQYYNDISEFIKEYKVKKKNSEKIGRVDLKILTKDFIDNSISNANANANSNNKAAINNSNILSSVNGGSNPQTQTMSNISKTNSQKKQFCSLSEIDNSDNHHNHFNHFNINHSIDVINNKNLSRVVYKNKRNASLDNIINKKSGKAKYLSQTANPKLITDLKAKNAKGKMNKTHNSITIPKIQNINPDIRQRNFKPFKPDLIASINSNKSLQGSKLKKQIKIKKRDQVLARNSTTSPNKTLSGNEINGMTLNETLKIHSIPVKKAPKDFLITKMAKSENNQLIKTSASCYFNPNKVN